MARAAWGASPPTRPLYRPWGMLRIPNTNSCDCSQAHRAPGHRNESNANTSPLQRSNMGDLGGKGASLYHSVSVLHLRLMAHSHQTTSSRGNCWNTNTRVAEASANIS